MHVNSINNFSLNRYNTVEKPAPSTQTPSFGTLKFKKNALKNVVQNIQNSIEISLESDNLPLAEEKLKKFMKMFTEPWDFRLFKHPQLDEKFGALPKVLNENAHPVSSMRILPSETAAYNTRLDALKHEASDLNVEVLERTLGENNSVTYVLNIPAMKIKDKKVLLEHATLGGEFGGNIPSEYEVDMLKKYVYKNIIGKDLVRECNYRELDTAFTKIKNTEQKPSFDIYGELKNLLYYMQKAD